MKKGLKERICTIRYVSITEPILYKKILDYQIFAT